MAGGGGDRGEAGLGSAGGSFWTRVPLVSSVDTDVGSRQVDMIRPGFGAAPLWESTIALGREAAPGVRAAVPWHRSYCTFVPEEQVGFLVTCDCAGDVVSWVLCSCGTLVEA